MSTRHELIADLLMGAAHADQHLDGRELEAVKQLVAQAMRAPQLPMHMNKRIDEFDPKKLDVLATVGQLRLLTKLEQRNLLELIAKVHESDDMWDFDEDAYLRQVANALGMDEKDYSDLTVEVLSIEGIGAVLMPPLPGSNDGGPKPPPLPA